MEMAQKVVPWEVFDAAVQSRDAKRLAMVYSFFASCKLNRIDPLKWLHAVLQRMPDHPVNRLHELLPLQKNWSELYGV